MSAYVIAILNVTNPEAYERYKELVPPSIAQYGGCYLARGGRFEMLEGDSDANRVVLLEFDSYTRAQEWWASPEYEEAKPHRRYSATAELILVEGLS